MRIAVTGGAGFVGSAIVRALLAGGAAVMKERGLEPHAVRVIDDLSTGQRENVPDGVDWHCVDAGSANYDTADAVVHAAAYPDVSQNWKHPRERDRQWHANADLTRKVLDRTPEGAAFVLLSTCSVYGGGGEVNEGSPVWASSPYAASKIAAEALVNAYTAAGRVRGMVLRLVNVVGARYAHGHLADFVRSASEGHVHALDDGAKRKSFVHVDDVAAVVCGVLWTMPSSAPRAWTANITSEVLWSWRDSIDVMRITRPDRAFTLTCENRKGGWVGDPDELVVSSLYRSPCKTSVLWGVRQALISLGWV